jgi:aryl-alcohol dehydrogenase-like predicted oxidoreductase
MPNQLDTSHLTRLGSSELYVSRVALGCWPISGISSLGVTDAMSVATIRAAVDHGVNFFDTAYSYGYDGRSDRVLGEALRNDRDKVIIAHKVGTHWDDRKQRVVDGRPSTLIHQAETSLKRLNMNDVDVMYLHCPDPAVPIEESAACIAKICQRGLARYAAVSNVDYEQAARFNDVCPIIAIQPYFNLFQQDAVNELLTFAKSKNIAMVCYWVLMKGLLSGRMLRDHVFDPADRRLTYPIYQGRAWQHAQDVLDQLRGIAVELQCTVTQLVVAWSLTQPGVSVALVGAKRPDQILESVGAMHLKLDNQIVDRINSLV